VAVVRSFSEWAKHSWDVDELPQALAYLPLSVSAPKEGLPKEGFKVSTKDCMMVIRHAMGGQKVCFVLFNDRLTWTDKCDPFRMVHRWQILSLCWEEQRR
jgi:hypothetical protein